MRSQSRNSDPASESPTGTNSGSNFEETYGNGNKTSFATTIPAANSTSSQSGDSPTRNSDSIIMGKSATLGTNSIANPLLNQKEKSQDPMKINVCSWNIRRGLAIREQELTNIIKINQINMIFLVETDTSAINNENDYSIQGFKTIIQKKEQNPIPQESSA